MGWRGNFPECAAASPCERHDRGCLAPGGLCPGIGSSRGCAHADVIEPGSWSLRMWRAAVCLCLGAGSALAQGATSDEAAKLFEAQRWGEAAAAYQSIVDREPANAPALIRLARSRAANGEDAAALDALKTWLASGSGSFQVAMALPEFEALRAGPRFAAIVEPHRPCNTPEFRQFDFWLGDWDVEAASAPGTKSRNQITR